MEIIECPCGCKQEWTTEEWSMSRHIKCSLAECQKILDPGKDVYYIPHILDTGQKWILCEECTQRMDDTMLKINPDWKRMVH